MPIRYRISLALVTTLISSSFAKDKDTVVAIHGPFAGSDITLRARASDGGAVYSLTWKNKEFLNSSDKGRDLQFAWDINGMGEAFNPTEAGSQDDQQQSHTRFASLNPLSLFAEQGNLLRSAVYPAYWLKATETSPNVRDDVGLANIRTHDVQPRDKETSDDLLETRIRIGPEQLPPNVIRFEADITFSQAYRSVDLASPTGYLNPEFNTSWRFNPRLNILSGDVSNHIGRPKGFGFSSTTPMPLIVSTRDEKYAIGIFSDDYHPDQLYLDYSINSASGKSPTNYWSIDKHYAFTPPGKQSFVSFVAVGTLLDVEHALTKIYSTHPYHLNDPRGFIETADANHIAGWVFDPRAKPGEPLNMDISTVDDSGNAQVIATGAATKGRPDIDATLVLPRGTALAFDIPLPPALRDGQIHYLVTHVTSKDGFVRQYIPSPKAVHGR